MINSCVNKSNPNFKKLADKLGEGVAEDTIKSISRYRNETEYHYPSVESALEYIKSNTERQYRLLGNALNRGEVISQEQFLRITRGIIAPLNGKLYINRKTIVNNGVIMGPNWELFNRNIEVVTSLANYFPNNLTVRKSTTDKNGEIYIVEYTPHSKQKSLSLRKAYEDQTTLNAESLKKLAEGLKKRIGIDFEFVPAGKMQSTSERLFGDRRALDSRTSGFYDEIDNKIFFFEDNLADDLVWHEFTHPIINAIFDKNKKLYNNLLTSLQKTPEFAELERFVQVSQPDLEVGSEKYNKELLTTAIGFNADKKFKSKESKGFIEYLQELFKQISDYFKTILKIDIKPELLNSNLFTLDMLSEALVSGTGKIIVDTQPETGYTFKTEEVVLKNFDKIASWANNKSITTDVLYEKIQKLGVPKEQLELLKNSEGTTIGEKLTSFLANYSYTVEINTAKKEGVSNQRINLNTGELEYDIENTQHYSSLTVPGGTNYTENEIATPSIIPSIKGHAKFATDKGIGWFRSDDKEEFELESEKVETDFGSFYPIKKDNTGKTRRILELQSDLFQKGRDKEQLIKLPVSKALLHKLKNIGVDIGQKFNVNNTWFEVFDKKIEGSKVLYNVKNLSDNTKTSWVTTEKIYNSVKSYYETESVSNNFLQLLNKDNNWVTFFVKSIIQDSAKKGYEKVLFPTGNTASKVEGHSTLEQFKKEKEDRIKELESSIITKEIWTIEDFEGEEKHTFGSEKEANEWRNSQPFPDAWYKPYKDEKQQKSVKQIDNEINQLKQELERVDREGFGALKPIWNFYENVVANILKKQGYNPITITDEYGNTWNEIIIDKQRDLSSISFRKQQDLFGDQEESFEDEDSFYNLDYTIENGGDEIFTPEIDENESVLDKKDDVEKQSKVIPITFNFTRESVKNDNNYIYLFTDNAKRTSGKNSLNNNSWYALKYRGVNPLNYPTMTQAVVRGLDNAFPITTMVDDNRTQWKDSQFDEYKKIIDDEIETIKEAQAKFKGIKFAAQNPFGQGKISNMKQSAPKIWNYLNQKLAEIGIDNTGEIPKIKQNNQITPQQTKPTEIKPGVQELFESNPELANEVYEALGFGKESNNISTFANYSGAAQGGDTIWENVGKEFGLGKQVNYRPEDLRKLTKEQLQEVENAYLQAVRDLGRRPLAANTFAGGLVRRDYLQAKAADTVFAISTIVEPGQKDPKGYTNKTNRPLVAGGTGYAVQMAINLGKPVYVFDQNKNQWFVWNNNTFEKTETPTLTSKFAGIGTREINENGKQAIRDVYEKTTQSQITPQQKQQAQQLYSQYLDTIFPNSKVKDIVYHGNTGNKTESRTGNNIGIWYNTNPNIAREYNVSFDSFGIQSLALYKEVISNPVLSKYVKNGKLQISNDKEFKQLYQAVEYVAESNNLNLTDIQKDELLLDLFNEGKSAYNKPLITSILNIKSPIIVEGNNKTVFEVEEELLNKKLNNDSFKITDFKEANGSMLGDNYVVFEPEQIHILGSKQDIQGFKEFVSNPITSTSTTKEFTPVEINTVFTQDELKDITQSLAYVILYDGITNEVLSITRNKEKLKNKILTTLEEAEAMMEEDGRTDILPNYIKAKENVDKITDEFIKYLKAFGTAVSDKLEEDEGGNPVKINDNEISDIEKAPFQVKLLVATTPEMKKNSLGELSQNTNNYLGLAKSVNFIDLWKYLKKTLANTPDNEGKDGFELMLGSLHLASEYRPEITNLLERLDLQSEQVKTMFFRTFKSSEYVYETTLYDKNSKTGDVTITATTSDISSAPVTILNEWNENSVDAVTYIRPDGHRVYSSAKIKQVKVLYDELRNLISDDLRVKKPLTIRLTRIALKVLKDAGIEISEKTLHHAIDDIKKEAGEEITNLAALRRLLYTNSYSIFSYINNLATVLPETVLLPIFGRTITEIFNQKSGLTKLAELESLYRPDLGEESVVGAEGVSYQKFANETFLFKTITNLNNDPTNDIVDAKLKAVYNGGSLLLKHFKNGGKITPVVLNNFKKTKAGDAGSKMKQLTLPEIMANSFNLTLKSNYLFGLSEADKALQIALKGLIIPDTAILGNDINSLDIPIESEVIDIFTMYLADEINRRNQEYIKLTKGLIPANKQLLHYHYNSKPFDATTDKPNTIDGNFLNIYSFPDFDLVKAGIINKNGSPKVSSNGVLKPLTDKNFYQNVEVRTYIKNTLLSRIKEDAITLAKNKVISLSENKEDATYDNSYNSSSLGVVELTNLAIDSKVIEKYGSIEGAIANYTIKSIIGAIEQTKVINGDPASYKGSKNALFKDYMKRTGGSVNGYSARVFKNDDGTWAVRPSYTSAVINNVIRPSAVYIKDGKVDPAIVDFILKNKDKNSKLTKAEIEKTLSAYLEVNQTDAQAWITLDAYRERMRAYGKWTFKTATSHEEAYKRIKAGETLTSDYLLFAQPLKTVHFELIVKDGIEQVHYNKQSEAVLLPGLTKDLNLDNLRVAMEEHKDEDGNLDPIDHVIVVDGKKTGASGIETAHTEGTGELKEAKEIKLNPVSLSYNYLFLQQDLPTKTPTQLKEVKGLKDKSLVASQINKNVLLNVKLDGYYTLPNGTILSGQQLVDLHHGVNSVISNKYTERLVNRITNDKGNLDKNKFTKELIKELKDNTADNIIDAILKGIPLDAIPGIRTKSQNKVSAMFRNAAVKFKQPGGSFIQLSNLGVQKDVKAVSDDIFSRVLWLQNKSSELLPSRPAADKVKPAQVLLPYSALKQIPGIENMSEDQVREALSSTEVLRGVMYRIPNQALSSSDAFEIVGILPPSAGDTIVAYADITTKTGADFDIDKAFVTLPHVYFDDASGMLLKTKYNINALEGSTTEQLENLKLDIMYTLLNDSKSFYDVIKPLDNPWLNDLADEIAPEVKTQQALKYFTGTFQAELKYINDLSKSLVGVVANHMTHHAVSQADNFFFYDNLLVGNKNESGRTMISRMYDKDSNLISDNLSTYANAIVDAAKNPTLLARLNLNTVTAPVLFMLTRIGASRKATATFMIQPAIKALVEKIASSEGRTTEVERDESGKIIKPFDSVLKDLIAQEEAEGKGNILKLLAAKKTPAEKLNYAKDVFGYETLKAELKNPTPLFQYKVLELFKSYQTYAKELNRVITNSKQDVDGGGKTLTDAYVMERQRESILRSKIINANALFSKDRMNNAFFNNTVTTPLDLLQDSFVSTSNAYRAVLDILEQNNPLIANNPDLLNKINGEIYAYMISGADSPVTADRYQMLFGEKNMAKRVAIAKQTPIEEMKGNLLLKYLKVDLATTPGYPSFVYINRDKKLDPESERNLYKAWLELYNHEKFRRLSIDLVKYSYISTGFVNSLGSFFHLIPTEILEEIGFVSFIKEEMQTLTEPSVLKEAVHQIVANLSDNSSLLKTVTDIDKEEVPGVPKNISFKVNMNKDLVKTGTTRNGKTPVYASYIRDTNSNLYMLTGFDEDTQSPNPIYTLQPTLGLKFGVHNIREYDRYNPKIMSIFTENTADFKASKSTYDSSKLFVQNYDISDNDYYDPSDDSNDNNTLSIEESKEMQNQCKSNNN